MTYRDFDLWLIEQAHALPVPMAKGQTKAATAATNLAPGYNANAQQERSTLLPAYQNILAKPGYSDADKSAMTLNTLGGLGAGFGSAEDTAMRRTARTGNTAGFGETLDELARERGRETSTAEAGLQSKFADTALAERARAQAGLSNLYGVDTGTMSKLLQTGTEQKKGGVGFSVGIPGVASVGYSPG